MKITVDRARCTGLGICESLAPDVFEVNDAGDLVVLQAGEAPEEYRDAVEAAVSGSPTEALRLER